MTGLVAVATGALVAAAGAAAHADVSPPTVEQSADPGAVVSLTKTVTTPEIPPKPDIVLLADQTGSMGSALNNVKANMADIITTVKAAQPDAEFAVATYCDEGDPVAPFTLHQDLSSDTATVTAAVNGISLCYGGDTPEGQLNALWQIGDGGDAVSFRPDSSRIVAWFGDAPGHDPSVGHTEADATASLLGDDVRVLAVSVGANQLDQTGQATRITQATGGSLLTGVSTGQVAAKILEGLQNLPVEVAGAPACDPGLSVGLDPASQTVTSGTDAVFTETITVADDAEQGATLTCTVPFTLNGADGGPGFTQTVQIHVNDVTAPTVSCDPGPNPAGQISSSTANGFVVATAGDNVDDVQVTVTDLGSGQSFGPYASGTSFKLTKAPGGKVSVKAGSGSVDWKLLFTGDAQLSVTDGAGNTASAVCSVPPNTP
jgi:hypothetical protein